MRVGELFALCAEAMELHWAAGRAVAERPIPIIDGAVLMAVPFGPWRDAPLVLLGDLELAQLNDAALRSRLFHADASVLIVAGPVEIPEWMVAEAERSGVALWRSPDSVARLQHQLMPLLLQASAPRCQIHGVLLLVGGVGTLLLGDPGIGKGSLALALLGRGHRLVADDSVQLVRTAEGALLGSNPGHLRGYLFVRGLGVVDVAQEFGAMALAFETPVEQLISLRGTANGLADEVAEADEAGDVSAQTDLAGELFRCSWLGVSLEGPILRGSSGAADRVEAYTRRRLLAKRGHWVVDAFRSQQRDA